MTTPMLAISTVTSAIRSDGRMTSVCWPRARCHALMASTNMPAVTNDAVMVWVNAPTAVELVSTAPKSVSSARPRAVLTTEPTGCCIQEFAARMK